MEKASGIQVLFVDDNPELCTIFSMLLEAAGAFTVHTCTSAAEGLNFISENIMDAIISDYSMPEMDGIEFLRIIRKNNPKTPFIILTGEDSKETAIDALNSGADFYQNKGERIDIQILDIAHKIKALVGQRDAEEAVRRKDAILEAISYAADQFLKGNLPDIDSRDILSRLGIATQAEEVSLFNLRISVPDGTTVYDRSASWSRTGDPMINSPSIWPKRWHQILSNDHFFSQGIEDIPDDERYLFEPTGIRSILIIPIYANEILSGFLAFIDRQTKVRRSAIEIQSLRMAAEIIGSARYRTHIEEFYKLPTEEAIVGVFLLCGNYFRYVNPRISTIFGYRREDLLQMENPLDLFRDDDQDMCREHIQNTVEGKVPSQHFECIGVRKDKREIFLEIYLTTINCQGSRCIAGNIIDVTERRKIQQSLLESEERYRRLAEQLDDLILVIDMDWKITYGNPAAMTAFPDGFTQKERDIRDLLTGIQYRKFLEILGESMADGSIRSWSMGITFADQGNTWYDISFTPLKIDENRVSSVVIYFHDVSGRVEREEEIRRAGLAQLELNMEQFQILNDEIRNPLQVIKGYNLLQGGDFGEKIDAQLQAINDLIDKLDRAWVQSEKVHKFLLRHYQHGFFIDSDTH